LTAGIGTGGTREQQRGPLVDSHPEGADAREDHGERRREELMAGRARAAFACTVLLVTVAGGAGGASGSTPELKRYSIAQGVTLRVPAEWQVSKPTGHELFWAIDRKHESQPVHPLGALTPLRTLTKH
jgi:hypothetical protein